MEQDANHLEALLEISSVINSILRTQPLLEKIMDITVTNIRAERGFIILREPGSRNLEAKVKRNMSGDATTPAISSSIVQQAITSGEPVLTHDAKEDPRFDSSDSVILQNITSAACVPLKLRNRIIGAIYVDSRSAKSIFTDRTIQFLSAFANQAAIALDNARVHESVVNENLLLKRQMAQVSGFENMVGKSQEMQALYEIMKKVIPISSSVLIEGESGTGKELVARAIHYNGPRKAKPFVAQQCSAIPETLLESELFGHAKGAFTGAKSDKKGLFEAASGGTFFLDEVGDISPSMQAKLLRALQEGEVRRLGENASRKVDVRIISATNKNLRTEVQEGRFREDLYYRLKVISIALPPLRERTEDVPLLAQHFLEKYSRKCGKKIKKIDESAMEKLRGHSWPGNVRELENTIERAVILCEGNTILPRDLILELDAGLEPGGTIKDFEKRLILNTLRNYDGNRTKAAKALGISVRTLQYKLKNWKDKGG